MYVFMQVSSVIYHFWQFGSKQSPGVTATFCP